MATLRMIFELIPLILSLILIIKSAKVSMLPYNRRRHTKLMFGIVIFSALLFMILQISWMTVIDTNSYESEIFLLLWTGFHSIILLACILFADAYIPRTNRDENDDM